MNLLAETTNSPGWIAAVVVGILATLVGGLVLLYLKDIKSFIGDISAKVERHDRRLEAVEKTVARRQAECLSNFTSKEDWVRAEGYTRRELKEMTAALNRLDGKLDVVSRLPEISAEIAARTAERVLQEVKNNG
ncbi:MAG: hypothetical protein U9R68_02520 [Planctomycetota bacterium]|nr:hypothetical protein [Planctomycetota bacterium]